MAEIILPVINDYAVNAEVVGAEPKFVGVTENPSDGVHHIPVVYGLRKIDGIRIWNYVPDTNSKVLYCAYALSEGWTQGINKIFIDDLPIDMDYSLFSHRTPVSIGGQNPYSGLVEIEYIDGRAVDTSYFITQPQNIGPSSLIARDLFFKLEYTKLSYIVCKFIYNEPSPFSAVPKIGVELFGKRIQPFQTGVIALGSAKENPVDQIWDLLQSPTYGAGVPRTQIDYASFNNVQNAFNTVLSGRGQAALKAATSNWIADTSQPLLTNINTLLQTYSMTMSLIGGKYYLGSEFAPSDSDGAGGGLTFNESNIVSNISIQYPNLSNKYNRVIVEYPDRDYNYEMRSQVFPPPGLTTSYLADDGNVVLEQRVTANSITDYWHAGDLAKSLLLRSRGQINYRFTADKTAHRLRLNDFIFINTALPLISNQKVIVIGIEMNSDYTFNLECVTYDPTFYPSGFTNQVAIPPVGTQNIPTVSGTTTTTPVAPVTPTPTPTPPQTSLYTLSANGITFNEGSSVVFTVNTEGVSNGTVVNWKLTPSIGSIESGDISPSATSGQLTINSNTASYTLTLQNDALTEGSETWTFTLTSPATGQVLAIRTIIVQDTSLSQPPQKYAYTYSGASFVDTVNATNVRTANQDWYMAFGNALNMFDSGETLNNTNQITWSGGPPTVGTAYQNSCVRQRIMNTVVNATTTYSTIDIDIGLVDRLSATQNVARDIYCVYDNFDSFITSTGQLTHVTIKSFLNTVSTFNPTIPPTGTNTLKTTFRSSNTSSTSVAGWERIDNTNTITPQSTRLPGIVRLRPVSGRPGHYATNVSTTESGQYTIKVPISVGNNSNPNQNIINGGSVHNCYLAPFDITSSFTTNTYRRLRLHFFEVNPTTLATNYIGYKVVGVGLHRGTLTAKYYDISRQNLTKSLGTFTNPMPA